MSNNEIRKQANSINPPRTVSFSISAGAVLLELTLANEQRLIHLFLYIFGRFFYHLISHDDEHGQPATQKPPCRK